ncbi:CpsD/CapB family tyrosine-protein kinase [Qipengyuania sp.]|uniref:CpsD/CapB family tyrosine-protein kinase n=1 Tax=Qipengyuania sp. TaxID=2004515 RepID=UPI00373673D9
MNTLATSPEGDWSPAQDPEPSFSPASAEAQEQGGDYAFSDKLVLLSGRGSLEAETISLLLSELLSQHVQNAKRGITFCSPSKDTGCTYIAANIAVAMAMSGVRTILVDANLRDPAIDRYITPPAPAIGLLQCLNEDEMPLAEAIHHEVLPNLSVLYAGGTSSEAGLLASTRAGEVFGECLRDYACVIVDTAPANRSSDAMRVANILRYALIIARKDKSYVNDIKKLASDIRQNKGEILGTFLNAY